MCVMRVTYNTDALAYSVTLRELIQRPTQKKMNSWIKSLFLFVFAHKKYSCRLINLRLSHYSHLDYFNDVFTNFSGMADIDFLAAYEGVSKLSDYIKNILICVPKMNESRTGLEQHEGE